VVEAIFCALIIVVFVLLISHVLRVHVLDTMKAGFSRELRSKPGTMSVGFSSALLVAGLSMMKIPELTQMFCVLRGTHYTWQSSLEQQYGPWVLVFLSVAVFLLNVWILGFLQQSSPR
jgi:hypothetical protein